MTKEHPNISILKKFDLKNIDAMSKELANDFVWHYFNTELPDLHGDYLGFSGFKTFFETMAKHSNGTFNVKPVSVTPIGNELVVTHVIDEMVLEDRQIELDAAVLWRIVDGKITEGWDIPAVNTTRLTTQKLNLEQ